MRRVDRRNPCPVCGKPDWCGTSEDGGVAVCMRVRSATEAKNGGWVHIVHGRVLPVRRATGPPPVRVRMFDAAKYHAAIRRAWDGVLLDGTALSLGVDADALDRLAPGYDACNRAVGFPMRDADGDVTGIRLRAHDGRKWSVSGSVDGMFYDPALALGEGRELVVAEGVSDTAAAYTLGLAAVGRSSCRTGAALLGALCGRLRPRLVTIVCDRDGWTRHGAGMARAGVDGAVDLGRSLGRPYRVVVPPVKDLRCWLVDGLTREGFEAFAGCSTVRLR
jgi:hypothetical protein